ncbi:hypothetical protein [Acinetobacter sp. YH01020]|uniref:hypothetical protein n=1 Tax=Acinetobacter sp. YH01020 TaxID=2601034 RepID=UPI0015D14AC8|nr:hypothetical protein [Acinetobacter sp. YH01020]
MAVQPQTPFKEYTANGTTTVFPLDFDCENKDHLIVMIDDAETDNSTWSLNNKQVTFNAAPENGKKITLQRNTPYRRDRNYQAYDNSFRPDLVNKDFDWIWWKLQELGVANWLMKQYVDKKDDELKAFLLEEIRKQGVALDQLDEYYNYLMQRLAQIAVDKGWDASFVVDASGKTQQEINNFQKERFIFLEDFGAVEGGDNTTAFKNALLKAKELGGGVVTTNIKNHSITGQVIYFDDTIIDLRGATVNTSSNFCNALYNSARTEYAGHYGAEAYYRYQQALDAGVPFSKFEYSSAQGDLTVRVQNADGFAVGDTIMINNGYCDMWRVMESDAATNAHIWNRDDVPLWKCEFAVVKEVTGNTLALESKLKHNYPLVPITTGIFLNENALPEYANWNTPNVIRLGGASNVVFKNTHFKRDVASQNKMLHASLALNVKYENCSFAGLGYGAELTSCVDSAMINCTSKTEKFGLQIRRSYLSKFLSCKGHLLGNVDSSIILWEGCHDCVARDINTQSADGITGSNIGFYINTSWDCHAENITANNAESVVELSFSHDCTIHGVYGDNSTYLASDYCSRNNGYLNMHLRSIKDKSATVETTGLFSIRYANDLKYSDVKAEGIGKVLVIKSFGVYFKDITADGYALHAYDQVSTSYKPELEYLKTTDSSFDSVTFTTPDENIHNDRTVSLIRGLIHKYVYFANKANSKLIDVDIEGLDTASGLQLKNSPYTRVIRGSIGGTTQSIDFLVWGAPTVASSMIYIENTALTAPNKFKGYIDLWNYTESMSPLCKNIQYISDLSNYPQIALFSNKGGNGSTVWSPMPVSRNDVTWTFTERLQSAVHSVNTENKYIGKTVFNDVTGKFMMATGGTPTATWVATDNSASITPV